MKWITGLIAPALGLLATSACHVEDLLHVPHGLLR
jgi:hypothetical protein